MGGQGRCEQRIEVMLKMQNKKSGEGDSVRGFGKEGGCEQRIEVIVKMPKSVGVVGVGSGFVFVLFRFCFVFVLLLFCFVVFFGGKGGCTRRIEVIVKCKKKVGGRGQVGNERIIEVIVKIQNKVGVRSGCRGGGGGCPVVGRVRMDVNEEMKLL